MPPDASRDLDALIRVTEENRAELKKTQQKMEALEAAIKSMQNSRVEAEQRRAKRNPKINGGQIK
jgi:uncharacterized coiled-coil protein SlyX